MNRTLTAAVALAASLGMAGLAHAQLTTSPSSQPSTTNPTMTGPAGTQNPATMATPPTTTGSYGTQTPQANSQPMANQGQMNQAQTNQSSMPASRSEVQEAQQQLKSQGLYMGAIDGEMGPKTQTALMAFQRQHSLPQSAQLDEQTMNALSGNGAASGMTGTQRPSAATMPQGNNNAPIPAGNTNGAPGMQPGGSTTR